MRTITFALGSLTLSLLAAPAFGQAPSNKADAPAVEAAPELFIEQPGVREFRGVLIARPLQLADADRLGMTLHQMNQSLDAAITALTGFEIQRYIAETDEYLIAVPKGETENSVAARLLATGNFQYVEPDWTVYPVGCPNDANFASQWHHQAARLNSCAAWDLQTGSPNIVVAICDTGIRLSHVDLRANRREGYNVTAARWESAGGAINDVNGHGTNCSGCAAGNGNNGIGVSGIGWNLGHRTMRVTDVSTGSASLSNLTTAARLAADVGDKVASVSYSGVNSSTVFTAGTYVRSKGAMLVWAAGNEAATMTGNRNDNVLVVGASDQNDLIASFSNRGSLVDFVAPGVAIYTTSNAGDTSYAAVSGTSFACPITAGLCGLIWSRNPTLTPAEVESIIRGSCKDLGAAGLDDIYGYGRIDVNAAILATPPNSGDTVAPEAPVSLVATAGQQSVTLSWAANTETDLAGYRVYRSTTSGGGYTEVTTTPITSTTFVNSGLTGGLTYYYVVRAQDTSGNLSVNSLQAAATPTAPPAPVTLFSDGFESGNLTAGGWVAQNTRAAASTAARQTGSWGARLSRATWIEKSFSTVGYNTISIVVGRRTNGLDAGEFLYVEWWNGSAWTVAGTVNTTAWATATFNLPAAAADNAAFKFRFRTNANANNERGDVDNVSLRGLPN
jgi:subtilisin family serine protease